MTPALSLVAVLCLQSGSWLPGERVLISDFSFVDAVAASPWLVFAATRHGLLIYDRPARAWKPPVTALDGYPSSRVRAAIADQVGNAVWLRLSDGYVRYDVDARQWTRGGGAPAPEALAGVLTVEAALARAPAADALRALILTDPRLRTYQFTAAATTPDRAELFFGTSGMGLVRVDPQTAEWEALPFGLLAPAVGAIAVVPGGVWAATNAQPGERRGLSFVAADLSTTGTAEGGGAVLGFNFLAARRLLASGGALWLATERGVLRIDPATLRWRLFDLPEATSLAPAPDGVWVGTRRGLAVITRDDRLVAIGGPPGGPQVLSLLAVRDTLWVGTTAGVGQLLPGADAVTIPPELADRPSLRVPVLALARLQDTLVMATRDQIVWRNAQTRVWTVLPNPLALGAPTALAADPEGGVWIGGMLGLAHADLGRAHIRLLTVPLDVPAAVRDLAADGDYLWAATDSGLVRFDRRAALNR